MPPNTNLSTTTNASECSKPSNGVHFSIEQDEKDKPCLVGKKWNLVFNYVELLNAISMPVPSFVSAWFGARCAQDAFCFYLFYNVLVHLPFSVAFHTYHIFRPHQSEGMSLLLRRLDNCFIHVASTMIALGTSRSYTYAAFCGIFNLYAIVTILLDGRKPRLDNMMFAILLYTAPFFYYKQYMLLQLTWLGFAVSILVFVKKFGAPVHHPLMHVLLGFPQLFMLMASTATFTCSEVKLQHCDMHLPWEYFFLQTP